MRGIFLSQFNSGRLVRFVSRQSAWGAAFTLLRHPRSQTPSMARLSRRAGLALEEGQSIRFF